MGEMLKGDVHEQFTSTSAKLLTNVQSMKTSPQKWAQHPRRRPQSLVEQVLGKSMSNAFFRQSKPLMLNSSSFELVKASPTRGFFRQSKPLVLNSTPLELVLSLEKQSLQRSPRQNRSKNWTNIKLSPLMWGPTPQAKSADSDWEWVPGKELSLP